MQILSVTNLSKSYRTPHETVRAVVNTDLVVNEGELITLLGPSGCGKTTMLRCIAGLEEPDQGEIVLADRVVFSAKKGSRVSTPPERRGISMVFQNYALWPHMSVFENIAFSLRLQGRSKADIETTVRESLTQVNLWHVRDRTISQLSGGQQQRVAVARAIAPNPKMILFDEPLSNVDTRVREAMQEEIQKLQHELGLTALWVTHDQEEALRMSSRIVVINEGRVEQNDTPVEIWNAPKTSFVAHFLGSVNSFEGTVCSREHQKYPAMSVVRLDNDIEIVVARDDLEPGQAVSVHIRTKKVAVLSEGAKSDVEVNRWRLPLVLQSFYGDSNKLELDFQGTGLHVGTEHILGPDAEFVDVAIAPEDIHVFARNGAKSR